MKQSVHTIRREALDSIKAAAIQTGATVKSLGASYGPNMQVS